MSDNFVSEISVFIRRWEVANFWCVDSEMSESSVIIKIPISGVLWYGQSHCDILPPKEKACPHA